MERPYEGGWDFIKAGEVYQYKEGGFIAMVTVLEVKSDDAYYVFIIRIEKATYKPAREIYDITASKSDHVGYPGMVFFGKKEKPGYDYQWHRVQGTE